MRTRTTEEFGARELRREAENWFGDAFLEYSLTCPDPKTPSLPKTARTVFFILAASKVQEHKKRNLPVIRFQFSHTSKVQDETVHR